jgi:hypothetical protein
VVRKPAQAAEIRGLLFAAASPATAASAFSRSMMRVVEESGIRFTSTTLPP